MSRALFVQRHGGFGATAGVVRRVPSVANRYLRVPPFNNRITMTKSRLEAFSDGVLAIIITIMVLELKVPHGASLASLRPMLPTVLSYLLSFVYVAIYWNNHHHMLQVAERVNGAILWANMHLLFWLSLVPFVTGWMGENDFAPAPTAVYGVVLFMAAIAYWILQQRLVAHHGAGSILERATGRNLKGTISPIIYVIAIGLAFVDERIAGTLYVLVALIWLVPDRRFERALATASNGDVHEARGRER
jgi:uncharacterized membrane protein